MSGPVRLAGTVVIVALLAVAGWRGYAWWNLRGEAQDRIDAVSAARSEVTGLISISADSSQDDLDALLDGSTADFRSQLRDQSEKLRSELAENRVVSTGEVVSAGITSLRGDRAEVIVAAAGTVKNKRTKAAEPRNYRMQVSLHKVDGDWLVSGLEFVA